MRTRLVASMLFLALTAAASLAEAPSLRPGVTWYRFTDPGGTAVGLSCLRIEALEDGGTRLELRNACNIGGQSIDRTRTMTLDGAGRMTAASYSDAISGERAELTRADDEIHGWHEREEGGKRSNVQLAGGDTLYPGLLYLLALAMPREVGAELVVEELSAAGGFTNLGAATIRCSAEEELDGDGADEPLRAFRYEKTSERGRPMTLWVSPEGEMLRADWGGGFHSVRADGSTESLYSRILPAVTQVPCEAANRLCMSGTFPGWSREEMFRYWIEPELLQAWWPEQATVEPEVGGAYTLSWPSMGRRLQGRILSIDPPAGLTLRWRWDGDEDADEREVALVFTEVEGGTQVDITHGPYPATPQGEVERRGHAQGWEHFCTRLRDLER